MIWLLTFVLILNRTEGSSIIRQPCIVDSAFQNRFNEDNLIVTVNEKVYEIHIPGLTIVKEGLIDDYWPQTRNITRRINIATRIGIKLALSKNETRFTYVCLVSYDNCTFLYSHKVPSSDWNIVAGFYYQPGMAVKTQNKQRIAKDEKDKRIYAGLPSTGKECLECGYPVNDHKQRKNRCVFVDERDIHYKSYKKARKDPLKDKITAISVAWDNETQRAYFFVFFGSIMRYTIKGRVKEVDLSSMLCPISLLIVLFLVSFFLCIFAVITLVIWKSIQYYKGSNWIRRMQETYTSATSTYLTNQKT